MSETLKGLQVKAQDRVEHAHYGTGTVIDIDGEHTIVAFDETVTMTFVTSAVELTPSDTLAPTEGARRGSEAGRPESPLRHSWPPE